MKIGFDFDKVFIDYPSLVPYSFIDFLYKGKGYFNNPNKNGKMQYRYPGILEQKIRIFTHYPIFRPLIKSNYNALKRISKDKSIKTYLISSRYGFLKSRTGKLLDKYKFKKYFDDVYFNFDNKQPHIFKEQIIKKLKINIYVDDDIHLSLYLAKKMPSLHIYWINDKRKIPVNLPTNLTPIKNLNELEKKLQLK